MCDCSCVSSYYSRSSKPNTWCCHHACRAASFFSTSFISFETWLKNRKLKKKNTVNNFRWRLSISLQADLAQSVCNAISDVLYIVVRATASYKTLSQNLWFWMIFCITENINITVSGNEHQLPMRVAIPRCSALAQCAGKVKSPEFSLCSLHRIDNNNITLYGKFVDPCCLVMQFFFFLLFVLLLFVRFLAAVEQYGIWPQVCVHSTVYYSMMYVKHAIQISHDNKKNTLSRRIWLLVCGHKTSDCSIYCLQ